MSAGASSSERPHRRERDYGDEPLPPLNSIHRGVVTNIKQFGAFVELEGFKRQGLVHISRLANSRVEAVEDIVQVGEAVFVKVVGIEDGKISLSMRDVDQSSGQDLDPENKHQAGGGHRGHGGGGDDRLPEVGSIHKGTVRKVMPYGAFIDLPGYRKSGLVHISRLTNYKVEKVEDVLSEGDSGIWVKVIAIEDGKIQLSMRVVDQTTGKDLDPGNSEGERARKKGGGYDPHERKIEVGAIVNHTCSRCGLKGHFETECYQVPGGKVYELLEEPPEPDPQPPQQQQQQQQEQQKAASGVSSKALSTIEEAMRIIAEAKEKKRRKKEKKKKKKEKKSKKEKKHKKKKKKKGSKKSSKKGSSSSSSSDSDSDSSASDSD